MSEGWNDIAYKAILGIITLVGCFLIWGFVNIIATVAIIWAINKLEIYQITWTIGNFIAVWIVTCYLRWINGNGHGTPFVTNTINNSK